MNAVPLLVPLLALLTLQVDERAGDRTQDLRIKSPLLYQLSYPLMGRKVAWREAAGQGGH
jgi:hypothetical protein